MKFFSHVELTTTEGPDRLQFRIVRQESWIDNFLGPILLVIFLYFARSSRSWWFVVAAVLDAAWFVNNKLQGNETELTVTNTELIATGNLERWSTKEIRIPAHDVTSIEYRIGGEGESSGLYIKQRRSGMWVLPGLNEEQCNQVLDSIFRRFPDMGGDGEPGSLLFGKSDEPIQLGLNKTNRD